MTGDHDFPTRPVGTPQLRAALEQGLSRYSGKRCRITELQRKRYPYSTSFRLEQLTARLDGGAQFHLIFKDVSRAGLSEIARLAKPDFLYEPLREIMTYREILSHLACGTATCYGAVADTRGGRYWLLLEHVSGRELYQFGDVTVWADVARWLARLHDGLLFRAEELRRNNPHLISYDAAYYRRWFDRAQEFFSRHGTEDQSRVVDRLAAVREEAVAPLAGMPVTLVHGELYASNVVVAERPGGRRVCPVDWEMAGLGPGLLDVAALCAGWQESDRRSIALGYRSALNPHADWPPREDDFLTLLDACRLLLAVQWLGWSPQWSPPPEHARDWLCEAVNLVRRLGL